MRTNETHQEAADGGDEASPHNQKGLIATESTSSLSRRSFFGRMGVSTALAAATSASLPALLVSRTARADDGDGDADDPASRRWRSYQLRKNAALAEREIPTRPHPTNGDEKLYPNFIGSYSQGLPHDSLGEKFDGATITV